jgi:hypothetical protein
MLFKKKNNILVIFYLLISFILTISFVGIDNIYFNEINWLLGAGDRSNAQNGWTFFKEDQWRFPLGLNPNYGLDVSTSIIFSDSLPLFAFLFKIFKEFLSENFQYFSLWILICFFLQLYISYLIILKITENNFFSILSSFLFVIAPIFIYRMSFHISLGGQWLILFGFYLNLINQRDKYKINLYWIFLLVLSTLIHLYFTVMLFGLYSAYLFQKFVEKEKLLTTVKKLIITIVVVLFFMYVFGYFEAHIMGAVSRGYGELKLNLLGIIDPEVDEGTASTYWSIFFKNIPGTTLEGFNYLGLGNIFLLVLAIAIFLYKSLKNITYLKTFFYKHLGYLLAIILLTLWSLTTNVSFMDKELINIPLNNYIFGLLSIFASTGRFFWPVYYLLLIFSIIIIYKNLRVKYSFFILVFAFMVQIIDTSPALKHHFFSKGHLVEPQILKDKIWNEIPKNFDKFRTTYLYNNYGPLFSSLSHFLGTSKIKKTDIVLVAAMDRAMAASTRYNFNKLLFNKSLPTDTAYVVDNLGHLKLMKYLLEDSNYGFFYRDNFWLVLPNKKVEMTKKDINLFSKIKFNKIILDKNYDLFFNDRDKLLGVGWTHNFGNAGVWSEGNVAFIMFNTKKLDLNEKKIKLSFEAFKLNKKDNFKMKIYFNNILKSDVNLKSLKNEEVIFSVKNNEFKNENIIMFELDNLVSPLELFKSPDGRKLGILLKSFKIETVNK